MGLPVDEKLAYDANGSYWDARVALKGDNSSGYVPGVDGFRAIDANPAWTHYQAETVAAVVNGVDGTYSYYLDMATFRKLGVQLILSGGSGTVTVTVEAAVRDDGTAPASVTYLDVTNALFGSASFTASTILVDDTGFLGLCKWVKIKVVASTGGADDADWSIYSRRTY